VYALKTPAAEVAHALLIVMRRGSLRAVKEITGHKYETISTPLKRAATHAEALTQMLVEIQERSRTKKSPIADR